MAEIPPVAAPKDPLRAKLGEKEWMRLTDERARQQQAAQAPPVVPATPAPPTDPWGPNLLGPSRYASSPGEDRSLPAANLREFAKKSAAPPTAWRKPRTAAPTPNTPMPTPVGPGAPAKASMAPTPTPGSWIL